MLLIYNSQVPSHIFNEDINTQSIHIFSFHIIPVHLMKITDVHIFQQAIIIFGYVIALFPHSHMNKIIWHRQQNLSYYSN